MVTDMAKKPQAKAQPRVSPATGPKLFPRYPLGPTTIEITVLAKVRDGDLVEWHPDEPMKGEGLNFVTDHGADLEKAKEKLFMCALGAAGMPPKDRAATAKGSVAFTRHAMERAHRMVLHLEQDEKIPEFLAGADWKAGKIGIPKGDPPLRIVNLTRPE